MNKQAFEITRYYFNFTVGRLYSKKGKERLLSLIAGSMDPINKESLIQAALPTIEKLEELNTTEKCRVYLNMLRFLKHDTKDEQFVEFMIQTYLFLKKGGLLFGDEESRRTGVFLSNDTAVILLERAFTLYADGNLTEATFAYSRAMTRFEVSPPFYYLIAASLYAEINDDKNCLISLLHASRTYAAIGMTCPAWVEDQIMKFRQQLSENEFNSIFDAAKRSQTRSKQIGF